MAKAGFWLRGANGKLAGSTIYKGVDGTIIREVVKPKNPRSSKQLYQRAIIATVMRYYALGKEIFNHSFEGYGVGMPTMRRFQSVNAKRLRALIAADLANGTKNARVVAPGITAAVPNPLIASMGTYTQSLLTHDASGNTSFPAIVQNETIAEYAQRNGLIEDDIYTILVIGQSATDMAYEYVTVDGQFVEDASVATTFFNWVQLRVKAGVTTDTTVITANTTITDIFDVQFKSQSIDPENFTIGDSINFVDLTGNPDYTSGAIAIIRSREDSGLRSNSTFDMIGQANKGVTAEWILPVWRAGSNVGNSDLILEGADFSQAGGAAAPTLEEVLYVQNQVEDAPTYLKWLPLMKMGNGTTYTPVVAVPGEDDTTLYYSLFISKLIDEQKQGQGSDTIHDDTFVWVNNPDTGSEPFSTNAYHVEDGDIRQVVIEGVEYPAAYKVVATMETFDSSAIMSLLAELTEGKFIYHAPA